MLQKPAVGLGNAILPLLIVVFPGAEVLHQVIEHLWAQQVHRQGDAAVDPVHQPRVIRSRLRRMPSVMRGGA